MTPERWRAITDIFHAALAREAATRGTFLDEACKDDAPLKAEVEAMLAAHDAAGSFGNTGIVSDPIKQLAPGTQLGVYRIDAFISAGGMGEVYKARDMQLGRAIALKVLSTRDPSTSSPARFAQEARAASALNHPNVCHVYALGLTPDGQPFIAMEYVEGETLRKCLTDRRLTIGEALNIAIQMASALSASHAVGVVHRDVKPENVMLTRDGLVKVLDFGLAKMRAPIASDGGDGSMRPVAHTSAGTIMGTVAYMSPEQAEGKTVDPRSDIFSFGSVLYEMVTGRRAFAGTSSSDTLAALIRDQPTPPRELAPHLSQTLERIILRCLRKEPARRYQHIGDVKLELEDEKDAQVSTRDGPSRPDDGATRRPSRRAWMAPAVVLLAALAAVAAIAVWGRLGRRLPSPRVSQLSTERWTDRASFSPDGTQIAYASAGDDGVNWDIWLKIIGQTEARQLTTDSAAEGYPAWSPDGNQIAFLRYFSGVSRGLPVNAAGFIQVVSPLGGESRRISEFPARSQLSWSVDGRWLAAAKAPKGADPPGGIYLISVATGEARPLTVPNKLGSDVSPAFSPDGRTLAYIACDGGSGCELFLQTLDADLRPQGERRLASRQNTGAAGVAWTRDGRSVLYDDINGGIWRVRIDGSAPPERLELAAGRARSPSTASGRDRLVYVQGGDADLYRLQIDGTSAPLVQSTFFDIQAQYSHDGRRVALTSLRAGRPEIWLANADGSNVTRLTHGPGLRQQYPNWSPDDKWVVFQSGDQDRRRDVWAIGVSGSGLRQITSDPGDDMTPSWSRDGRHIYFTSNRTGREEIWRIPADGGGPEEQLTKEGGSFPFESLDGAMLYYKRASGDTELLGRSIGGGEERVILPCVPVFGYAVVRGGIVYHDCASQDSGASARRTLYLWEEATRVRRAIGSVEADWIGGLTGSPDGKYIVYGRGIATADLMMIENFR